jgi:hypothetical protein
MRTIAPGTARLELPLRPALVTGLLWADWCR